MANPFHQLRRVKLQLVAVVLAAVGIGLVVLGYWLGAGSSTPSLQAQLVLGFGFTFLTAGAFTVLWESYLRGVNERVARDALDAALRRAAPAFRDTFLDALAFDADALKDVASDDHLDKVATNAIALRLKDKALAGDLYADLRDQVIHAPERWHDVKVSVSLSTWADGPASGHGSMFVATVRWEYRVKPASGTLRFACVGSEAEYRELLRDPAIASAWYFEPVGALTASSQESFELMALSVDGRPKKIRRTARRGDAQVYAVGLGQGATDRDVVLSYSYRVLVQRHGHVLYLDVPRPTKGFHVELDYRGAGIAFVNSLDYFASHQAARVERARSTGEAKTVNISFDGWMLPRAGVAFVWVLEEELE